MCKHRPHHRHKLVSLNKTAQLTFAPRALHTFVLPLTPYESEFPSRGLSTGQSGSSGTMAGAEMKNGMPMTTQSGHLSHTVFNNLSPAYLC